MKTATFKLLLKNLLGKNIVVLGIFCGMALWAYRNDLVEIPGCDQWLVLEERARSDSDLDFFRRMVIAPWGDQALFRPATMSSIALSEIFLHAHPLARGLSSLLLHCLATQILFLVLVALGTPRLVSLGAGMLFATYFPGMDMVSFRHISPYIGSLIFFGLALLQWKKEHGLVAGLFFFIAALFHEAIAFCLPAVALFLMATERKWRGMSILLLPALCYFALKFGRDLAFSPTAMENIWPTTAMSWLTYFYRGLLFAGVVLQVTVFPLSVDYTGSQAACRKDWTSNAETHFSYVVLALFILGFVARVVRKRRALPMFNSRVWWTELAVFFGIIYALIFFRVGPRGWYYMKNSNYYLYLLGWHLIVAAGASFLWTGSAQKQKLAFLLLAAIALYGGFAVNRESQVYGGERRVAAQAIARSYRALESRPEVCLSSLVTDLPDYLLRPMTFSRALCSTPGNGNKEKAVLFYPKAGEQKLVLLSGEKVAL